MRMGTDAAALLAETSAKADHNLASELAQLRAANVKLQQELEESERSVEARVKEEIKLAQEFLEQRNDELRIEVRKRQQLQSAYFTAKAQKEVLEQDRDKLTAELEAVRASEAKLLQRDKRSKMLLEETRNNLLEQQKNERLALTEKLDAAAAESAGLQQRVQLLLQRNAALEEQLANAIDDCTSLRLKSEKQEEELRRLRESAALASAASSTINETLAAAQGQLEASRAEAVALHMRVAQLRGLAQVNESARCLRRSVNVSFRGRAPRA
jgi:chromosome segregation ATPase